MLKLPLAFLVFLVAALPASAALRQELAVIDLRYTTAAQAREALELELGSAAASAIHSIDSRRNSIAISAAHSAVPQIREFLVSFDQRPPHVTAEVKLTRRIEAADGAPAREEILLHYWNSVPADRPLQFTVPPGSDATHLEVQIKRCP